MATLLQKLLRIPPGKVACNSPGFREAEEGVRRRLRNIGEVFRYGYNAGLADSGLDALSRELEQITPECRGFAYEGAAMALDILDQLKPRAHRVAALLRGPGAAHVFMVHVGVGWSMARFKWRIKARISRLDPLLRWLALDGLGFHEGYFHWQRHINSDGRPRVLRDYGLRAFDQGLGRSLWFVAGANPGRIVRSIAGFPASRHADLWSGIGLACAYAGGAGVDEMELLFRSAGSFSSNLAQGVVFAAAARDRAGNPVPHTDLACRRLCGLSVPEAVAICNQELTLACEGPDPVYETWRRRIQMHFVRPGRFFHEAAEVYAT